MLVHNLAHWLRDEAAGPAETRSADKRVEYRSDAEQGPQPERQPHAKIARHLVMGLVYEERFDFQPVGDSPLKLSQWGLCLSRSAFGPSRGSTQAPECCSGQCHDDSDGIVLPGDRAD